MGLPFVYLVSSLILSRILKILLINCSEQLECHMFAIEPAMVYTIVVRVPRPTIIPAIRGLRETPPGF